MPPLDADAPFVQLFFPQHLSDPRYRIISGLHLLFRSSDEEDRAPVAHIVDPDVVVLRVTGLRGGCDIERAGGLVLRQSNERRGIVLAVLGEEVLLVEPPHPLEIRQVFDVRLGACKNHVDTAFMHFFRQPVVVKKSQRRSSFFCTGLFTGEPFPVFTPSCTRWSGALPALQQNSHEIRIVSIFPGTVFDRPPATGHRTPCAALPMSGFQDSGMTSFEHRVTPAAPHSLSLDIWLVR